MTLKEESKRVTEMLQGKIVAKVVRHRATEVVVESTDGSRFFVDRLDNSLDLSVTKGRESFPPQD